MKPRVKYIKELCYWAVFGRDNRAYYFAQWSDAVSYALTGMLPSDFGAFTFRECENHTIQ